MPRQPDMREATEPRAMKRRTFVVIGATGAAALAAFAALPRALRWARARYFKRTVGPTLLPAEQAMVRAYANALLPRTQTPGALDVGVPEFVAVMNAENYGPAERALFADALSYLDETAHNVSGKAFVDLEGDSLAKVMQTLETPENDAPRARAYTQLRRVVLHGYFTSEPIQRQVLRTVIMPGRFDGNAPFSGNGGGGG